MELEARNGKMASEESTLQAGHKHFTTGANFIFERRSRKTIFRFLF